MLGRGLRPDRKLPGVRSPQQLVAAPVEGVHISMDGTRPPTHGMSCPWPTGALWGGQRPCSSPGMRAASCRVPALPGCPPCLPPCWAGQHPFSLGGPSPSPPFSEGSLSVRASLEGAQPASVCGLAHCGTSTCEALTPPTGLLVTLWVPGSTSSLISHYPGGARTSCLCSQLYFQVCRECQTHRSPSSTSEG